jgi:hypothetical protein
VLLQVPQVLLSYPGDVCVNIREGIRDILLAPEPSIEQYVKDSLLFHEHFISFVLLALGDPSGLSIVDSMRRWFPVVLDGSKVRGPYKYQSRVGCLHHILQQSSHIEVFGHEEYMAEVLYGGSLHGDRHLRFRYLLQHELEDVLGVLERE